MRKGHSQYAPKAIERRISPNRKATQKAALTRARLTQVIQPVLEALEDRRLLSTSVSFSGGILTLNGDPTQATHLTATVDSTGKQIHASADQGHAGNFPISGIKQIVVNGGSGNDYVYMDGNIKLPITINSGEGNDTIRGGGGTNTIVSGNGNNWISGRGTSNYIKTGNGKNTIGGGNGNDTIIAGNGNDSIDAAGGNDSVVAGNGNDFITTQAGNDTIVAGNGNDNLNGGLGDDRIVSGTGVSIITPGSGNNTIILGNLKSTVGRTNGHNTIIWPDGKVISGNPTPAPQPAPAWTAYAAAKSSDKTAPQAIMEVLAPAAMVGIGIHVRALDSTLGAGSPITANYQWDFGDKGSAYNTLLGFNASHIYNTPGTYTIRLTVTNELGKSSTVGAQFTIAPDSRHVIYVDAVSGSDSNDGSSQGKALKSAAKAESLVRDYTEILFHRGQTFNLTTTFMAPYTNVLVDAYGSGSNPVMAAAKNNSGVSFSTQQNSFGITIRNLTFDTNSDANRPMAIVPRGTDISIINCTFLHVVYAVNANGAPQGLTVEGCKSPNADGIAGYFLWDEGKDTVMLGNTVAGVQHEHVVRTSSASEILAAGNNFTNNDGKGCIQIHAGAYAWIEGNTVTNGDIRTGPLGLWGEAATSATDYVVIQGNTTYNTAINLVAGSHHISIRNNVLHKDTGIMIDISSIDGQGRYTGDVHILNNTGLNNGKTGEFLKVENHTQGITLQNNLLVAPNMVTGGYGTAPVFVTEKDLSSFTYIGHNVWQLPASIYRFANGGINIIDSSSANGGYRTPAQWNAFAQVHDDIFTATAISSSFAPTSTSMAASAAAEVAGVVTDINGKNRPTGGIWSAGAIQVG